jgi:hypothetical protein
MVSEPLVQTLGLVWAKNQCELENSLLQILSVTNLGKNREKLE